MTKKEPVDERNLDGSGAPTIPWDRARERFGEDTGISPTHWLATVCPRSDSLAAIILKVSLASST